ncbi:MAG: hypothetical protein ACK55Z_13875, partial [bacterium]
FVRSKPSRLPPLSFLPVRTVLSWSGYCRRLGSQQAGGHLGQLSCWFPCASWSQLLALCVC